MTVLSLAATSAIFLLLLPPAADGATPPFAVAATRTATPIVIDAVLEESSWQGPATSGFTQRDPHEGSAGSQRTEVWVAYDDEAIYIAARLHDTAPDSIVARLARRDSGVESDWMYVGIDSYHDKRTGFYFGVNAAGSIDDGVYFNDEWTDDSWDGVWDAAARIDGGGWSAEIRIPYSQLRFQKQDEYVWGINFLRKIERHKEEDWYARVPKNEHGGVSRWAELTGIRGIDPPRSIEIVPYVASGVSVVEGAPGDPFRDGAQFQTNIGGDLRLGLGTNMTLNATVNPDFGQVEVDPAVVNLTQYETFFEEKRPFFIQGTNFFDFGSGGVNDNWGFNWGNPDFLYTRRIGRPPQGSVRHEGYTDIPDRTTIIGAAKLTGRLGEGWTGGLLQAVTAAERGVTDSAGVRFEDVVEPLASYTTLRVLREFNQGAQGLGALATGVFRSLSEDYLPPAFTRSALTLGADGWVNLDPGRVWVASFWAAGSRVTGSPDRMITVQRSPLRYYQRPDEPRLGVDSSATSLTGFGGRMAVNKQEGNWKFNAAVGTLSPGFEVNDLGFSFRTDKINGHLVGGYQWFEPDGVFRRKGFRLAYFQDYEYSGRRTGEGLFLFYNTQFMNYWSVDGNVLYTPAYWDSRKTRGGPGMVTVPDYAANIEVSSDDREKLVGDVEVAAGRSESGGFVVYAAAGLEWKPSAGVRLSLAPQFFRDVTDAQWVQTTVDPAAGATYGSRYVFGTIDQREVSASIRLDWTFTPRLSLQLFLQPLVSVGTYSGFKELAQPGTYSFNVYGRDGSTLSSADGGYTADPDGTGPAPEFFIPNPDFNFKSLRANAVLRWEYLPGSTLYLVWTQNQANESDPGDFRLGRDLGSLLEDRPDSALLLKVAYWINP